MSRIDDRLEEQIGRARVRWKPTTSWCASAHANGGWIAVAVWCEPLAVGVLAAKVGGFVLLSRAFGDDAQTGNPPRRRRRRSSSSSPRARTARARRSGSSSYRWTVPRRSGSRPSGRCLQRPERGARWAPSRDVDTIAGERSSLIVLDRDRRQRDLTRRRHRPLPGLGRDDDRLLGIRLGRGAQDRSRRTARDRRPPCRGPTSSAAVRRGAGRQCIAFEGTRLPGGPAVMTVISRRERCGDWWQRMAMCRRSPCGHRTDRRWPSR